MTRSRPFMASGLCLALMPTSREFAFAQDELLSIQSSYDRTYSARMHGAVSDEKAILLLEERIDTWRRQALAVYPAGREALAPQARMGKK